MKKETEKPYNGGQWTEARMRSFAMSALRRAQWPAKYQAISQAYIGDGLNPKTGKPCKLHKCPTCKKVYPKGNFQADHINPVIPLDHKWTNCFLGYDWNEVMRNLWCEKEGFVAICKECHKAKSKQENIDRKQYKKQNDKSASTGGVDAKRSKEV